MKKREAYRKAFDGFEPLRVARFDTRRIRAPLANPGLVRKRLKVKSAVKIA